MDVASVFKQRFNQLQSKELLSNLRPGAWVKLLKKKVYSFMDEIFGKTFN